MPPSRSPHSGVGDFSGGAIPESVLGTYLGIENRGHSENLIFATGSGE